MAVPGGSTDWSNVNGEDLTWLRDKTVNEIAPSAVSDILNSHGGLGFLKGTNIQMGLSQGERGGATTGSAMIQINATNVITLALMLDDDLLSDAVNAGTFTSEEAKRMLYETIGHELVHAVMYVVTSRGMTNATSDPFPSWYVDGMANALTGDGNWLTNYLSGSSIVYRVPDAEIRKTYDIAEAINATHNLNRFVQHPVYDDAGLGEVVIENGMYEPLEQVPDELLDSLDRAKVGALVRKKDGVGFYSRGYSKW